MQKSGTLFSRILLLLLFVSNVFSTSIFGQHNGVANFHSTANTHPPDSAHHKFRFQPAIGLGIGMLSYIGNIPSGSSNIQNPSVGRVAYNIGLSQKLSTVTEFSLNFLIGTLGQTEKTTSATWNFQSSIEGGSANFLFKILPKQNVTPYILIGIESYKFLSRANIYDSYGTEYYGWSDGTLRSLPQSSPEASSAKILPLNYELSSNINQINIGGAGNYSQQTLAIPVGIGFLFHLTRQVDFMVGSTVHYTFTQNIDGLTPQVHVPLKDDRFAYTYATLRFTFNSGHSSKSNSEHDDVPLDPTVLADTVHPDKPGSFDTSGAALKLQYEKYMDTTGQFAEHYVDTFQWKKDSTPARIGATQKNTTTNGALTKPTTTASPTPIAATNTTSVETAKTTPATVPMANTTGKPAATAPIVTTTASTPSGTKPGLVFKIPLGIFRHEPDQAFLTLFKKIPNGSVVTDNAGLTHYTTGPYNDYPSAQAELAKIQAAGLKNAFIMAFYNGNKIPIQDALTMLKH